MTFEGFSSFGLVRHCFCWFFHPFAHLGPCILRIGRSVLLKENGLIILGLAILDVCLFAFVRKRFRPNKVETSGVRHSECLRLGNGKKSLEKQEEQIRRVA